MSCTKGLIDTKGLIHTEELVDIETGKVVAIRVVSCSTAHRAEEEEYVEPPRRTRWERGEDYSPFPGIAANYTLTPHIQIASDHASEWGGCCWEELVGASRVFSWSTYEDVIRGALLLRARREVVVWRDGHYVAVERPKGEKFVGWAWIDGNWRIVEFD